MSALWHIALAGALAATDGPAPADDLHCMLDRWCLLENPDQCIEAEGQISILAGPSRLGLMSGLPDMENSPELFGPHAVIGGDPLLPELLTALNLSEGSAFLAYATALEIGPETGTARTVAPSLIASPAERLSQPFVQIEFLLDFTLRMEVDRAVLPDQVYPGSCIRDDA